MTQTMRWGILGAATIASTEFAPAVRQAEGMRLVAVGSRRDETARRFADEFSIRAHGSYEALLNDPEVDAVYIALPNSLHREWAIAALEAGKHVLCEKPVALSAADAAAMAAAATRAQRVLMEGFMWRFHPRTARIRELIAGGEIGEVRMIRATYAIRNRAFDEPERIADAPQNQPDLGGGALNWVGCYGVDALVSFARGDARRVRASRTVADGWRVDTAVSALVEFDDGVEGQLYATIESAGGTQLEIIGTQGRISSTPAFRLRPTSGRIGLEVTSPRGHRTEGFEYENQYRLEAEHFARVVHGTEKTLMPLDDSVRTARIMDAIRASWAEDAHPV